MSIFNFNDLNIWEEAPIGQMVGIALHKLSGSGSETTLKIPIEVLTELLKLDVEPKK